MYWYLHLFYYFSKLLDLLNLEGLVTMLSHMLAFSSCVILQPEMDLKCRSEIHIIKKKKFCLAGTEI